MKTKQFYFLCANIALAGCFKLPVSSIGQSSGVRSTFGASSKSVTELSKSVTTVDPAAQADIQLSSPAESKLSGTSITIAPGSLNIATNIVIEQGADLGDSSVSSEISLGEGIEITQAGAGTIIRPSENADLKKELQLALPLPVSTGLKLAGSRYAVYYKFMDPESKQLMTGVKAVDDVSVKIAFDSNAQSDVMQFSGYFGIYWIVILNRPITVEEVPVAKVSNEPIVNKNNTPVITTTGVVKESDIVAIQSLPEVVWQKPVLKKDGRSISLVATSDATVGSCKADYYEKISDVRGWTVDSLPTAANFTVSKLTAHTVVGRQRCVDSRGRTTMSPWSDEILVEAYDLATIDKVYSDSAAGFYAMGVTVPVKVHFTKKVTVEGKPVLNLKLDNMIRPASYVSGSGSDTLTFTYTIYSEDNSTDLNYVAKDSLVLAATDKIVDDHQVPATVSLPDPASSASLAGQSAIVVDALLPKNPSSVSATVAGSLVTVNAQGHADSNLGKYSVKLCGNENCSTSCGTAELATSLPFTITASVTGTQYACVRVDDLAGNQGLWVASASISATSGATANDSTAPTVLSVSSPTTNGLYKGGELTQITIQFSEIVSVTNTNDLSLLLETGASDHTALYAGGSGTDTLSFNYSVQNGADSTDLNVQSAGALSLGVDGTIKDAAGNNAVLTLPFTGAGSLAASKDLRVDGQEPTPPATITFTQGSMSSSPVAISWVTSTDTHFSHHSAKLCDTNTCIGTCTAAFTTAGTSISIAGTNATSYYACVQGQDTSGQTSAWAPSLSTTIVDGFAPAVTSVTSSKTNATWGVNTVISISVAFSEIVNVTDPSNVILRLETGTTDRSVAYTSGTGTNTLVFDYTVQAGDLSSDLDYISSLALTSWTTGTVKDDAGNSADLTLPAPGAAGSLGNNKNLVIDAAAATIVSVSSNKSNGSYAAGTTIDVRLTLSRAVTVAGGIPSIVLNTTPTKAATYASGSGTTELVFNYTIASGDTARLLNYAATTSLAVNAATMKDSSNNDLQLTLPATGGGSSLAGQRSITVAGNNVAPSLGATPTTQDRFTGAAITAINVNNVSTSNDTDADGDTITYTCFYDTTYDGAVASGTACASLPADSFSFNTTTGVLNWTPSAAANPSLTNYQRYEFAITGTDTLSQSHTVYPLVTLLRSDTFVQEFTSAGNYTFDTNKFNLSGGYLSLAQIDQMDHDGSSLGFGSGNGKGAAWDGSAYLTNATVGGCSGHLQNCSQLDPSWVDWSKLAFYVPADSGLTDVRASTGISSAENQPTLDSASKVGSNALSFNGSNNSFFISRMVQNSFTISFWMNTTSTYASGSCTEFSDGLGLVSTATSGIVNDYGISVCDGFIIAGVGNPDTNMISPYRINDGKWHHIAFTREQGGGTIELYIDGMFLDLTTGSTNVLNVATYIDVGRTSAGGNNFIGKMDELAIWNNVLSWPEIFHIHERQRPKFSGQHESRVMDSESGSSAWNSLAWKAPLPYGKELPDYNGSSIPSETGADYTDIIGSLGSGLTHLYHLGETIPDAAPGGADVQNFASNLHHGALFGTYFLDAPGIFNSGLELMGFGGTPGAVNLGSGALDFNTNSFTAQAWVRWTHANGSFQRIIGNGMFNQSNGWVLYAGIEGSSKFGFGLGCEGQNTSDCVVLRTQADGFNDGGFHHVAVVVNRPGATIRLYVDGVLQAVDKSSLGTCGTLMGASTYLDTTGCNILNAAGADDSFIGKASNGDPFNGIIDEIAIWSRVLTSNDIQELYLRGANRVKFQIRSCSLADCSDGSWKGPDGTVTSYFTETDNKVAGKIPATSADLLFSDFAGRGLSVATNRYFQYRVVLEAEHEVTGCINGNCIPELTKVFIGPNRFNNTGAYVTTNVPANFYSLASLTEALGPGGCAGGLKYQLSIDNSNWYYHNGSGWMGSDGSPGQASTAAQITSAASTFATTIGAGSLFMRIFPMTNGMQSCSLDSLSILVNNAY